VRSPHPMAIVLASGLFLGTASAPAADRGLVFQAPTIERPAYLVKAFFEVEDRAFRLVGVEMPKGNPWKEFAVLKDGRPADATKPLPPGGYEIDLRYAWRSGVRYALTLRGLEDGRVNPVAIERTGLSPEGGGIPSSAEEGFSAVFVVSEEAGIARKGEIAFLILTGPKADLEAAELAVFDGPKILPHQVVETRETAPTASQAATHPPTLTKKIAATVEAEPRERKLLRVFKAAAGPGASPPAAFDLSGEGWGKTVKGSRYALGFHPKSGQIDTIEDFRTGLKLFNKAGVIHWNPDVFIPGIAWDHSFDWNPPESFEESRGPLLYLNSRAGPMPRIKDVFLEVKYTLEKEAPHFIAETRMRVDRNLGVVALRNDEMVLFRDLFDALAYRDKDGAVVLKPLREIPGAPHGLAHTAPPDLGWVGLVSLKSGAGFFSLRLESSVSNLGLGGDFSRRAGTYFYAPADGDYVYWVRPWLYTWGESATANLLTALPAGSMFYEKNAYLVLRWDETAPEALDALLRRLKNPLRVW